MTVAAAKSSTPSKRNAPPAPPTDGRSLYGTTRICCVPGDPLSPVCARWRAYACPKRGIVIGLMTSDREVQAFRQGSK